MTGRAGAREILPGAPEPFKASLAAAMTDDLPVPIEQVPDPRTAPVHFLPWLAVHDGVRLWFPNWSEARKRRVVSESLAANFEVGARAGAVRFLSYVDGTLVDAVAYPARFVMGRAVLGRTPIGHGPFLARYLVRIRTVKPSRAFVIGRSAGGRAFLKTPDRMQRNRVLTALRAAKSPETEYRVDLAHMRPLALSDAPPLDGTHYLGQFVPRSKL
ncbi:phage tail protein I [Rhodomicrobium lacus]|uniref:phage tail protein I n=1 Tax=Rhodomicrobium lacus TaxID=2498452 RepID=UPI000F8C3876|nr:phage tail protein I [Rhodomicrobium lacus]